MNHSGDANKIVDTPRTTDRVVFIDGNPWVNAPFARELERELNAANQRIKQLEDNRTMAAANSLANMLAYEDAVAKIKRLEEAGDALYENSDLTRFDSLQAANRKLNAQEAWRKAKEAKP